MVIYGKKDQKVPASLPPISPLWNLSCKENHHLCSVPWIQLSWLGELNAVLPESCEVSETPCHFLLVGPFFSLHLSAPQTSLRWKDGISGTEREVLFLIGQPEFVSVGLRACSPDHKLEAALAAQVKNAGGGTVLPIPRSVTLQLGAVEASATPHPHLWLFTLSLRACGSGIICSCLAPWQKGSSMPAFPTLPSPANSGFLLQEKSWWVWASVLWRLLQSLVLFDPAKTCSEQTISHFLRQNAAFARKSSGVVYLPFSPYVLVLFPEEIHSLR